MAELATVTNGEHARHDPLLVAQALDRGATPSPVLDLCVRCAVVYADLVALTRALPLAAYPSRRRDFILSPADARRLRPGGWRGRWSRIGTARDAFTRPLAIGFTMLGLAGLLITAAPTLLTFGAAAGAATEGPTAIMAQPAEGPPAPPGPYAPAATGEVATDGLTVDPAATLALSLGLLATGGGLFAVRRVAGHGRRMR